VVWNITYEKRGTPETEALVTNNSEKKQMNFEEGNMRLSCRIFGILKKEMLRALNFIPKW